MGKKSNLRLHPQSTNVEKMFDDIAPHYDFLNHFLSAGTDLRWRSNAIRHLKKYRPKKILDVATGTGDFAIAALKLNPEHITGIDISKKMLKIAEKKVIQKNIEDKISFEISASENLPFQNNSFDAVTVSFGVRNFKDLELGISEIFRVLDNNGIAAILEFSLPKKFPVKQAYSFYFRKILPLVGNMISKNSMAYEYLPETVMNFPQGKQFENILTKIGFSNVRTYRFSAGICSLYLAEK